MEFQFKKHVKVVVDLEIGEKVMTDGWGYKLDGKEWTIKDIKFSPGCESSILVMIDGYDSYIDSSWLNKLKTKSK